MKFTFNEKKQNNGSNSSSYVETESNNNSNRSSDLTGYDYNKESVKFANRMKSMNKVDS